MADTKISALPSASTPLTGTEVLPIVQGAANFKVAVSDLTAGRAVSALSFAGPLNGTVGATTPAAGSFTNITGSANAIISVTDNTNAALRITQLGTGNALLVEDETNPDASPFVIDNSGRTILGTTSSISVSGTAPPFQLHTPGAGASYTRWSSNATGFATTIAKSRSATIGTYSIVSNADQIGILNFVADDGTAFVPAASIIANVDGTPGTNDMPGRLVFSTTADGASSPAERMRIDSTGDIGIGTTSPLVKLEIAGNNNTTWIVTASISGVTMDVTAVSSGTIAVGDLVYGANIQPYTRVTALGTGTGGVGTYTVSVYQTAASSATTYGTTQYGATLIRITDIDTNQAVGQPNGALQFFSSDASTPTAGVSAYVAALAESVTPDTALVFGTRDNAGGGIDANERMRLTSDGNLGIGTTSPGTYGIVTISSANPTIALVPNSLLGATSTLDLWGSAGGSLWKAASIKGTNYGQLTLETPSGVGSNSYMVFSTSATERMRLDSAGNLGVGTSSPGAKLDVHANDVFAIRSLRNTGNGGLFVSDTAGGIRLGTSNGSTGFVGAAIDIQAPSTWTAGSSQPSDMRFFTVPSGSTTLTERMRLDSAGELTTTNGKFNLITVGRGAGAVATNTAVGVSALSANTTGNRNTANGWAPLFSNTTGTSNTAFGYGTLFTNIAGNSNTAIGDSALNLNTASNNTALGYFALQANTTASNNTAVGYQAGYANTTGANNTTLGYQAGYSNSTSSNNVAVGNQAGYRNTSQYQTFVGHLAGYNTTSGNGVTFIGHNAGNANVTGYYCTFTGAFAGYQSTGNANTTFGAWSLSGLNTGQENVSVGYYALQGNTSGSSNTALGANALYSNTTASNNTAVGYQAGYSTTTGTNNVALGHQAGYTNSTTSSNTAIGVSALQSSTGGNNTAVGYRAGLNATTATNNQFFGTSAGSAVSTGSSNVIIGGYTGSAAPISATGSNYIVLSDGDGNVRQFFNGANATFNGTITPQQATTAAAPAYVKGAMYFDTTLNKLRIGGATGWETVTSV